MKCRMRWTLEGGESLRGECGRNYMHEGVFRDRVVCARFEV
jgi:hypothetical protein